MRISFTLMWKHAAAEVLAVLMLTNIGRLYQRAGEKHTLLFVGDSACLALWAEFGERRSLAMEGKLPVVQAGRRLCLRMHLPRSAGGPCMRF
jgi:hypothetical protein